jgi:hypothetical protein
MKWFDAGFGSNCTLTAEPGAQEGYENVRGFGKQKRLGKFRRMGPNFREFSSRRGRRSAAWAEIGSDHHGASHSGGISIVGHFMSNECHVGTLVHGNVNRVDGKTSKITVDWGNKHARYSGVQYPPF